MRCARYLKDLLKPLGVYRLDVGVGAAELESAGAALDGALDWLEALERESLIPTAEGEGLEIIESLLTHRPVTNTLTRRREALAALLRVGGDSFTLGAINDNLAGCGLNTVASETSTPGMVEVRFPFVPGIPEGFDVMKQIIEDILPAHLYVVYVFWYITWDVMENRFDNWKAAEDMGLSWEELEKSVQE